MQQAKCGSAKTELILNECSNLAWYYCSDLILKNCWVASFIAGGGGLLSFIGWTTIEENVKDLEQEG